MARRASSGPGIVRENPALVAQRRSIAQATVLEGGGGSIPEHGAAIHTPRTATSTTRAGQSAAATRPTTPPPPGDDSAPSNGPGSGRSRDDRSGSVTAFTFGAGTVGGTRLAVQTTHALSCVFVAAFDTHKGNIIEWADGPFASEAHMDGVEYKAIPSGSHSIRTDYCYFKHHGRYGLAAFDNRTVDSVEERGARMRSVGILCEDYRTLHRHMAFLQRKVKELNEKKALGAADTVQLSAYLQRAGAGGAPVRAIAITGGSAPLGEGELPMPFTHLFNFFGVDTFRLWKAVLLRMRILFFSPVPIGVVCDRVHAVCGLASRTIRGLGKEVEPRPLFFVNVADLDDISRMDSYVACTSEKIFIDKEDLYDVFVDDQRVIVKAEHRRPLAATSGDKARLAQFRKAVKIGSNGSGGGAAAARASAGAGAGAGVTAAGTGAGVSADELADDQQSGKVSHRGTGFGPPPPTPVHHATPGSGAAPAPFTAGGDDGSGGSGAAAAKATGGGSGGALGGGGSGEAKPSGGGSPAASAAAKAAAPSGRHQSMGAASDVALRSLFVGTNDQLLEVLLRKRSAGRISASDMAIMGLHGRDAPFLRALLTVHGREFEVEARCGSGCA